MGKCIGKYQRVLHLDPSQKGGEVYDKFGNLISESKHKVEIIHGGRKLMISKKIQAVMHDFELTEGEVFNLWKHFIRMDKLNQGYIELNQLIFYIDERNYSIIAPYMERFLDLMDKVDLDRVTFEELIGPLVTFCLFSRDEMVTFVFNMLDIDRDDEISKKDLFRLLAVERDDIPVFPFNNMRTVEIIEIARGDKIHKSEFIGLVAQFPYLVFPAFRMQQSFKENFGGFSFWSRAKVKLEKKEIERKMILEREKFFERNRKKKDEEYNEKLEFYDQKVKEMNKEYHKEQKKIRHKNFRVRVPHRRGSDGLIGVNFPLEEPYKEVATLIEKKKIIREDNPYDMPILKDRLQYSFIWDRYTLYEAHNAEEIIRIDPTDARVDLGKEIEKLVLQKKKQAEDAEASEESFVGDETLREREEAKLKMKEELTMISQKKLIEMAEGMEDVRAGRRGDRSNSFKKKKGDKSSYFNQTSKSNKIGSPGISRIGKKRENASNYFEEPDDEEEEEEEGEGSSSQTKSRLVRQRPVENSKQYTNKRKSQQKKEDDEDDDEEEEDDQETTQKQDEESEEIGRKKAKKYGDSDEDDEDEEDEQRDQFEDEQKGVVLGGFGAQRRTVMVNKKDLPAHMRDNFDKVKLQRMTSSVNQSQITSQNSSHSLISKQSLIERSAIRRTHLNNSKKQQEDSTTINQEQNESLAQQSKNRNSKLPPIVHKMGNKSRIGDETLSQLSKQFTMKKQQTNTHLGDDTLSNLGRQMIEPTPAQKFKMMRHKNNTSNADDVADNMTVKSKWTVYQAVNGQLVNMSKSHKTQQPQLNKLKKSNIDASGTVDNLNESSQVSFNTKLYQQYDVKSQNKSELQKNVQKRFNKKDSSIEEFKYQESSSEESSGEHTNQGPHKHSKSTIKEEENTASDNIVQGKPSKKSLKNNFQQKQMTTESGDEGEGEGEESEEESSYDDEDDSEDDNPQNKNKLEVRDFNPKASNVLDNPKRKTNYEIFKLKEREMKKIIAQQNPNQINNNNANDKVLIETGHKVVHEKQRQTYKR